MSALLELRDVSVTFPGAGVGAMPTHALRGVSLAIEPGESVGLVGESGSGKSTAARVLLALLRPTSGEVRFEGRDPFAARGAEALAFRRAVQPVFQDPAASLDPRMRIRELVAEPLRVHRLASGAALDREVDRLLERVGLAVDQAGRYPHELSGGQKQRVAIARALGLAPRLLVADEAVSALDCSVQAQILNLFRDLGRELGVAMLFVAHDLAAVDFLCDRIAVMHAGRIVEILPRGSLDSSAAHPYTRLLVASVPAVGRADGAAVGVDALARLDDPRVTSQVDTAVPSPGGPSTARRRVGCAYEPRCPRATAICATDDPALVVHDGGALVACHHPEGAPTSDQG